MRTSGKKWLQDFSLKSLAKSLVIGAAATGMMSDTSPWYCAEFAAAPSRGFECYKIQWLNCFVFHLMQGPLKIGRIAAVFPYHPLIEVCRACDRHQPHSKLFHHRPY